MDIWNPFINMSIVYIIFIVYIELRLVQKKLILCVHAHTYAPLFLKG